jgi:hypothetical protein
MSIFGGDYLALQTENSSFAVDQQILAANAGPFASVAPARSGSHTVFVQKITLSIYTHAAQTVTFLDTAGTPVTIAAHLDVTPQAAGVPAVVVWDFGPRGTPLTLGKDLSITLSGAGIGARVHIEGYQKLGAVISANLTANTAN